VRSRIPILLCTNDQHVLFRIQNPLHGIPYDLLLSQVEEFAREKGMEDITELLQKGALLAQNPSKFESLKELDESDREIIRRETTRALLPFAPPIERSNNNDRQMEPAPRLVHDSYFMFARRSGTVRNLSIFYFYCTLTFSRRGWDQTGSNGANLSFPKEFGIDFGTGIPNSERNEWIVGLINAG
jgi:hypothetical protein